jgi:hypothetical protein
VSAEGEPGGILLLAVGFLAYKGSFHLFEFLIITLITMKLNQRRSRKFRREPKSLNFDYLCSQTNHNSCKR